MDQVEQVREKVDIVSLISEHLPLKKAGRNFKGNCPFHNEKTPSFVVSPERQIWHCFGCNLGGDVFTFLMEYERIEFGEALRMLAKRVGVTLVQTEAASEVSSKKEILYALNHLAGEFYHYILTKHSAGEKAKKYLLKERKISEKVLNTFMVGYSPKAGNVLVSYLMNKKQYKKEDILAAGLATQKGTGIVDFFANRLMFPLYDHRGNVVGFSGRILSDSENAGPKYVNTRETLIYHKSDVFFGLNSTKEEIRKEKWAVIMEGEFDVMSSFQNGIGNVVAVKGTALTENQVNLISRFAEKVSLCFDTDRAGKEAMRRSFPLLEKKGLTVTVVQPASGKDPDDAIKEDPYSFKQAVKHSIPVYDFFLSDAFSSYNKKTAEGKKQITDQLLPFLSEIDNEVVKEHYLRKLAAELDSSYESVLRQAAKQKQRITQQQVIVEKKEKKPREEILEQYLMALLTQHSNPKHALEQITPLLAGFTLQNISYQKIITFLTTYFQTRDVFNQVSFVAQLPTELAMAFDTCYLFPLSGIAEDKFDHELLQVARELKIIYIRFRMKILSDLVKAKEKEVLDDENEELQRLNEELSLLASMLQKD